MNQKKPEQLESDDTRLGKGPKVLTDEITERMQSQEPGQYLMTSSESRDPARYNALHFSVPGTNQFPACK